MRGGKGFFFQDGYPARKTIPPMAGLEPNMYEYYVNILLVLCSYTLCGLRRAKLLIRKSSLLSVTINNKNKIIITYHSIADSHSRMYHCSKTCFVIKKYIT